MELIDPQGPKIEKGFFWLQMMMLVGAGVGAVFLLLQIALGNFVEVKPSAASISFNYNRIGEGPLALGGHKTPCPVKGLPEEVAILGINLRPDAPREKVPLMIGLKSSEQKKIIEIGQALLLKETSPGVFAFSDDGDIKLIPSLLDRGVVRLDVGSGSFLGKLAKSSPQAEIDYEGAFQRAEVHSQDLLLRKYGGQDYASLSEKVQIDFGGYVCFVQEGDLLVWADQMWQEGSSPELPLAKVTSITSSGVEIEVWDTSGFREIQVAVPMKATHPMPLKIEEVLTSLRPKATKEITCLLGKRRVVLKAGDWWLKTGTGFKNIRRMQDIEDVLSHRLQGELFIFDEVSSEKGKMTIQGTYFDPTHTHTQPISMTANVEKKTNLAAQRRGGWKKAKREEEMLIQQRKELSEGESP